MLFKFLKRDPQLVYFSRRGRGVAQHPRNRAGINSGDAQPISFSNIALAILSLFVSKLRLDRSWGLF